LIDGGAWNERSAPVTPDDVADYGAGEAAVNPALGRSVTFLDWMARRQTHERLIPEATW
jgi:hypothetical protein